MIAENHSTDETIHTHHDVACTVCGCVCDDLVVHTAGDAIRSVERACSLAEPWFAALDRAKPPIASIEGSACSHAEAIDRACQILDASRSPLLFGLSRSSTAGQRAAVRLGEQIGATVDTTASVCHGPSIMAIQETGESTSTLGEIRNRADLVVFWGANPVESHPRHLERYSLDPVGLFLPNGRGDRKLVVIDHRETATARLADDFIQTPRGSDFELIWSLRQLLRGERLSDPFVPPIEIAEIERLADALRSCRYGVVFFGLGLAQSGLGHVNVAALLRLVADLNAHTRFTARRLRIPGDVAGADSVLCWQTGYPFAVNLARGYPRYNPGEYSANELLERGEVDACVLVGSESIAGLSPQSLQAMRQMPTVAIDYPHVRPQFEPTVQFTSAVYGIHAPGTAYRMDEIPLPLRKLISSPYPTDEETLNAIIEGVTDRLV